MIPARLLLTLTAVLALALGVACGVGNNETPSPTASGRSTAVASASPSGPTASIDPREGPPGTSVTVSGRGWLPGSQVVVAGDSPGARPYATVTAASDGSFQARFLLEKAPEGGDLQVGRLNLVARSGSAESRIAFQVTTRRPLRPTPSGG